MRFEGGRLIGFPTGLEMLHCLLTALAINPGRTLRGALEHLSLKYSSGRPIYYYNLD
jgi:hypothetical protein